MVTYISPIKDMVKNIGEEKIHLSALVPGGVNSHPFELIPSDAITISKANLIIRIDLVLEIGIER